MHPPCKISFFYFNRCQSLDPIVMMDKESIAKHVAEHFIDSHLIRHPEPVEGLDSVIVLITGDDEITELAMGYVLEHPNVIIKRMPRDVDSDPNNKWIFHEEAYEPEVFGYIRSITDTASSFGRASELI
jgi:hypothetical protein